MTERYRYLDIAIVSIDSHITGDTNLAGVHVEFPHVGCAEGCFLCEGYVCKKIAGVRVNRCFLL